MNNEGVAFYDSDPDSRCISSAYGTRYVALGIYGFRAGQHAPVLVFSHYGRRGDRLLVGDLTYAVLYHRYLHL